jgi:hypothetical protein
MVRVSRWLIASVVALALLSASVSTSQAQTVCYDSGPVVVAPVTTYYAPPVTTYYAPAPVVTSYYAPTYYAPAYYAPAPVVTTYRYGLLPRRSVTVSSYYAPAPVYYAPAPRFVRYRGFYYP